MSLMMSPYEEKSLLEVLPCENFANWVYAICVVTFDLELGQAMELIYPCHCELTERERTNICYLAFPDSNSGLMGNVQFHFRIRMCPESNSEALPKSFLEYNKASPCAYKVDAGYLYGYVYFRQVKDKSLKRGYFQKSVVLLSRLPLVSFFSHVMGVIAPAYFDTGEVSLEAACHDIDQWSPPTPGQILSLPLHGNVIKVKLTSQLDKIGQGLTNTPELDSPSLNSTCIIPHPHEMPAFPILSPILPYINLLWELVLVTEPIVVMATNPTTAANMVQTLTSLIAPLKFSCDFRPFFTIHDSEFKEYVTQSLGPPNVILGVTNPFFAKTLHNWPHIIRVDEETGIYSTKLRTDKSFKVVEHKPGVYTKYKPYLQTDKSLLKRLLKGVQTGRPVEVQSALVRRYLLELTQSFIIPLERYAASLMPLRKSVSPFKSTPSLRPFNPDEFLSTLENSGPQLTCGVKGDWEALYKRFFKTSNFSSWFHSRHEEISKKLTMIHIQAICDADLKSWAKDRSEVEVVDMSLRIKDKVAIAQEMSSSNSIVQNLNKQNDILVASLAEDLREVLENS